MHGRTRARHDGQTASTVTDHLTLFAICTSDAIIRVVHVFTDTLTFFARQTLRINVSILTFKLTFINNVYVNVAINVAINVTK